jgi:hypothetical protein
LHRTPNVVDLRRQNNGPHLAINVCLSARAAYNCNNNLLAPHLASSSSARSTTYRHRAAPARAAAAAAAAWEAPATGTTTFMMGSESRVDGETQINVLCVGVFVVWCNN